MYYVIALYVNFVIDLPLCQTIYKIDLTFMVTLTVHQTYTAQSFRIPPYYLILQIVKPYLIIV